METKMTTLTEKEQYELTIKNMQSKIDWLRDQRKLMDTYGKKYEHLTDEQIDAIWFDDLRLDYIERVRKVLAAHGIK